MRWASTVLLACEFSGGHRVGVLHHLCYVEDHRSVVEHLVKNTSSLLNLQASVKA